MNPYSTLSRRGFLNLAGAVGVSLVLPKPSFAATADGAVAESIGKFEDYLLNRLVSGMPQSGRGALQDCWRRFKIEPPCRLNFEPGLLANR